MLVILHFIDAHVADPGGGDKGLRPDEVVDGASVFAGCVIAENAMFMRSAISANGPSWLRTSVVWWLSILPPM